MPDAKIIPFPETPSVVHHPSVRICSNCDNAYMGVRGIYCGVYQEEIVREDIAQECDDYEDVRWNKDTDMTNSTIISPN